MASRPDTKHNTITTNCDDTTITLTVVMECYTLEQTHNMYRDISDAILDGRVVGVSQAAILTGLSLQYIKEHLSEME